MFGESEETDVTSTRSSSSGADPEEPATKKRKTNGNSIRSRLEKTIKKRGPADAQGGTFDLVLTPKKRGPKFKTASEKHLKHTIVAKRKVTATKSKKVKAAPKKRKGRGSDDDDDMDDDGNGDDEDDDDRVHHSALPLLARVGDEPLSPDLPPSRSPAEGEEKEEDEKDAESLSSASERRKARSRQEKKKKSKKLGSGAAGETDIQKAVALCIRKETVERADSQTKKELAAAVKARQTDSLVARLFESMKKDGQAGDGVEIETFSKLLMEHPEAAATGPPSKKDDDDASAAKQQQQPEDAAEVVYKRDADEPIPDVPFTHPLIQAISNMTLSVPALERYGDPLTPKQMAEQLAQKRLASPLLKTTDLSALLVEAGSIRSASGRILTFPGCIQGVRCQGKVACIDGLAALPLKERPLLMGFVYEHEITAYLACQAGLPTDRKCVLCLGVDFGSALLAIRGYSFKIHVEQMALLQTYRVPVDAPGGYYRGCTYIPEPKEFRFDPFPRVDTSFYYARRDPNVQLLVGPNNQTRPRWVIDDTSTHYQPPSSSSSSSLPPLAAAGPTTSTSSSNNVDSQSKGSHYLVYAEISISYPEKQKLASSREEKRLNSKENTSGKHRTRQSEREKTMKDNHVYSDASTRMLSVRCNPTRHAQRFLDLLPLFVPKMDMHAFKNDWERPLRELLMARNMARAHTSAVELFRHMEQKEAADVVPRLCVDILNASGAKCEAGTEDFTKERIREALFKLMCPHDRPGVHYNLLVQVARLTALCMLLERVHNSVTVAPPPPPPPSKPNDNGEHDSTKKRRKRGDVQQQQQQKQQQKSPGRAYNVIVYHLQCMVDSLWHVPYYVCEAMIRYERYGQKEQSLLDTTGNGSEFEPYLKRSCVPDMNSTNVTVACDRTIPFVPEFDQVYTKTHEKGKTIPAFHLFGKAVLTRNNRRKFPTVGWNYAELDPWIKDLIVRIMMSGLLGNYLCLTHRRPERRMPVQARFVLYKMYSSITGGGQQGNEFYKWMFMGMQHLALYTTHMHNVHRIIHHPALEAHCRGIFDFDQYHRVVENAVYYASDRFYDQVLRKPEVMSVHCLSKTPIPGMSAIAGALDAQLKKECESMFLRLVHQKMIHGFLVSLKDYMHYHPTVVWDHPRVSMRLHPYLEYILGPASLRVLEYALEPGCDPWNTTGIDIVATAEDDADIDVEMTVVHPVKIPTTCDSARFGQLLETRVPVQYIHLALMRKTVRTLHPLDRYPERKLFELMPVLGCSPRAVQITQDAMRYHELDDKNAKKNAIKTLKQDYPFSYSILQAYAELWRVHESVCTCTLPQHYYEAQVTAVCERFHVPPSRPLLLPDIATRVLFCNCCDCITTIVREEETMKRVNPNSAAAASSRAQRATLNKRAWDHGTVQTFTKIPRTADGVPTVHCVDEKVYLGEKCGQRPLAGILLLGKMLVFKSYMITLCVGRGCGRPCVIAPKTCEYGEMGYLCSVCSHVKRYTGADPSTTLVTPRVPLPDITPGSATTAPRKYYHTNARREIAEKKEILKKKKTKVVVCDACGADTDRPRIMTITQDAGPCASDGSDMGRPPLTVSSTITLTVCGMHHHEAPKYDMKKVYIEKKQNPKCAADGGRCTCPTKEHTCTGMWTRESVVKLMNSLDPNLAAIIESRTVRKTIRRAKNRIMTSVNSKATTTGRKQSKPRRKSRVRR